MFSLWTRCPCAFCPHRDPVATKKINNPFVLTVFPAEFGQICKYRRKQVNLCLIERSSDATVNKGDAFIANVRMSDSTALHQQRKQLLIASAYRM